MTSNDSKEECSDNNVCCVIGCNNHVIDGNFGLKGHRYGYCQIHKIEGTAEEILPVTICPLNQESQDGS